MRKTAILMAMLGVVAFGTMANKCEYNPTYTQPAPNTPADETKPAPADEVK